MISFRQYLDQIDFGISQLFSAKRYYNNLLKRILKNASVLGEKIKSGKSIQKRALNHHKNVSKDYFGLYFSQGIISGAILQIASQAIENFSCNSKVPPEFKKFGISCEKVNKFCIGDTVKGVPEGLIIYAGRNQHTHCLDKEMMKQTKNIFFHLSRWHFDSAVNSSRIPDPAFDLRVKSAQSMAPDILALLSIETKAQFKRLLKRLILSTTAGEIS